jgi:hypothetical protein
MQNFIFALLLVSLNISTFLLFAVNPRITIARDKKLLSVSTGVLLTIVIGFVFFGPPKYLGTFYMSAAIFTLFGLRFLIAKFLSVPLESEPKQRQLVKNFFDTVLFPVIMLFFCIIQCLSLLVWNS